MSTSIDPGPLKKTLCALYKYSGLMRAQEAVARLTGRSFMVILLFHRVTDLVPEDSLTMSSDRFRRLCRLLQQRFHVVPIGEMFRIVRSGEPFPPRTVSITFDDGYRDNLFAARTLAEFGLPACFFVTTSCIGTERVFEWDRGSRPLPLLTWDEVREMDRLGFEIGSHTVTHSNMASIPHDAVRRELRESKAVIEDQLGQRVRWFAYPFGGLEHFTEDRLPLVQEAGYDGCVSGYDRFIYPGEDGRILPRESVVYYKNIHNVELHLAGCLEWLDALKRHAGLLDSEWPIEGGAVR